jgi:hypothetical protein
MFRRRQVPSGLRPPWRDQNRESSLDPACDEDVRRLDIAVHDSFGVRGLECVGDGDGDFQQSFQLEVPARDAVLESFPFQAFHGDESAPILSADVVDGANVGMIQRRGRLRFALEADQSLRIFGTLSGRNFSATKRFRRTSSALNTTPMPPPPSFSRMR